MLGDYKKIEAIPCKNEDMHFFRRTMRDVAAKNSDVFVRQANIGDVLISETVIKRWRIVSENGKLYIGFYEKPMQEMRYQGTKCPLSYYVILEDERKNTSQKYALVRIPRRYAYQVMGLDKQLASQILEFETK